MKTKIAFAAALILAIAAAIGAKHIIDTYRNDMLRTQVRMAFAETNLRAGDALVYENVKQERIAGKTARVGDVSWDDLPAMVGRKLVRPVRAGDVLNEADFYKSAAEMKFTSEVPRNYRAVTIPVDQVAGVAGLIQPRDRVDVLATISYTANSPGGTKAALETFTVLENVTVLAIDNHTAEYSNLPERLRREGRSTYTSVTLSLTPQEARIVTLCQAMSQGMLTLVLRNPADDSSDVNKVSADSLWDALSKAAEQRRPRAEVTPGESDTLK